ncbi:hypothetical protein F5X68DRAFT_220881 [Plectosphaerella plurivora]|uniref:Rhodopsin domain-containing protein n=1 Tax=Plectosphaerella plurivora TaxID=936078 RepID=A0A9P8VIP8_9PEZI|nr:hypothetical protein F5X68DRAFT_220881 [Plectosphaerella plurivora]
MDAFLTEVFAFVGIGTLVVLLRLFLSARQAGVRHLQADDYLMLAAIIIFIAGAGIVYVVGVTYEGLSNSGMTNDERLTLDPVSEEYRLRVAGSQIAVAAAVVYVTQLWLVKASVCSFCMRLTIRVRPALSRVYLLTIVILNLFTDLYLILIPLPMVWKARLPICKRLGLIVLFSGALFVMVAVVLRCVLTLTNSIADTKRTAIWIFRECFVALIASNLPKLWAWIRHEPQAQRR